MFRLLFLLWLFWSSVFSLNVLHRYRSPEIEPDRKNVLYHYRSPEPDRKKYIWNPFPGYCGPNATTVDCGGVCPETCSYKSLNCLPHCGVPCICKPGYVFSETLLKCILRIDCSTDVQQQVVETHRVFQ